MISVQQAVDTIVEQVNKFPNLLPVSSPRLEEFDFDGAQWHITLSLGEAQNGGPRLHKTFIVDGNDGQIKAMRIAPPKG